MKLSWTRLLEDRSTSSNRFTAFIWAVFLTAMMAVGACESGSVSETPINPLSTAVELDTPELTEQALTDPDQALIEAAWQNDFVLAKALIESGADVNYKDETQQSAYLIATSEGFHDLLNLTFQHGADVASLDSFQGTGLIRSAERGHANVVGRLIRAGTDVDHVNRLGWTALHEAIILGSGAVRYVDTVRILIAGGADVELPSATDNVPPLQHAEARGQTVIANTLMKTLEAVPIEDPDSAVLAAALAGDADRLALALRTGANIEAKDSRQRTPLLLAAIGDHLDVARVLVALGADVDALDGRHDTPWLVTGVTGSVAMAEVLLLAIPAPDLTILNRFGGTSLIPAADRGHVEYVRRVSGTDIDIDHVNDLGWTALMEAVLLGDGSKRYQEIVALLLEAGANASIGDQGGVTPIRHASDRGYEAIVELLSGS